MINELEILQYYKNGSNLKQLSQLFNLSYYKLKKIFKKHNISVIRSNLNRKHFFNFDFFDKINSHDKAQILGLVASDGNISKRGATITITLNEKDKEYLELIKNKLSYVDNLLFYKKKFPIGNVYSLSLNSDKMKKDLINLGIYPAKSLILKFPTFDQVSEEFINSYILGYLEGDGCIHINKKGYGQVYFAATFEFCTSLSNLLKNKLNIKCHIYQKRDRISNNYSLVFGGNQMVLKFLTWIYKNCTFQMERKYKKYLILKNKYDKLAEFGIYTATHIGEKSNLCKLKALDVIDIKNRIINGERNIDIAKLYKVSAVTICNIKKGKSWKQLTNNSLKLYSLPNGEK